MRKLLSLSLGLFAAATSFAGVKTVTIPALPDTSRTCSFVVKSLQVDSLLLKEWETPLNELVGKTFLNDTTIEIINGDADTLKCNISTGTRPSVIANDTVVCYKELYDILSIGQFNSGSYWAENPLTGLYEEQLSKASEKSAIPAIVYYKSDNGGVDTINIDANNPFSYYKLKPDSLILDSIIGPIIFYSSYFYSIVDTITGCRAWDKASVGTNDCAPIITWNNYNGPKEYNGYRYEDAIPLFDLDTVMALDPSANCICPLPLDTIIENNRMRNPELCEYYKYDVTVKLVAHLGDITDTIVYYILHLDDSGSSFEIRPDTAYANYAGNCTFTVPEIQIIMPNCICGSYYYSVNLNEGDTIAHSTDLIYTFKNYCTGNTYDTVHIVALEKEDLIKISGGDTTVNAKEKEVLTSMVNITSSHYVEDFFNPTQYMLVECCEIILNVYKDTILDSNLVYKSGDPSYRLDNKNQTGRYFFVATDTISGCSDTYSEYITVLGDSTDAKLLPSSLSEVSGNIYTISGVLVMQNVYLKEVMDRLKEGLYIFNKQKIYIKKQ